VNESPNSITTACVILFAFMFLFFGAFDLHAVPGMLISLFPTVLYAIYYRQHKASLSLNFSASQYFYGFVFSLPIALFEFIVYVILALIFMNRQMRNYLNEVEDNDDAEWDPNHTPGFFIALFLYNFCVAAPVEQFFKYWVASKIKQHRPHERNPRIYVYYIIAAAIGFSVISSWLWIVQEENVGSAMVTAVARTFVDCPFHVVTAWLIAIQVIKRDVYNQPRTWVQCVGPSIAVQGALETVTELIDALWSTEIGVVLVNLTITILVIGVLAHIIRDDMSQLGGGVDFAFLNNEDDDDQSLDLSDARSHPHHTQPPSLR
jgi:RsiW-degrading membrane proteinase PrsW (M82 family)